MKDIGEKNEKIFTKVKCNNIIRNKYNPLNKDKCFYERKGFLREETKDVVLDEVIKGLNRKEKFIVRICKRACIKLYKKGMIDCFNYFNKDGTF